MKKTKKNIRNKSKTKKTIKSGGGNSDECLGFILAMLNLTKADSSILGKINKKPNNSEVLKQNINKYIDMFNKNEFNNPYSSSRINFNESINSCVPEEFSGYKSIPFVGILGTQFEESES